MLKIAVVVACAALLLGQGIAPAAEARTALKLVVRDKTGGPSRAVLLQCDPPKGPHHQAPQACADITAARGDLKKLRGDPTVEFCTMDLRPVLASALGTWRGKVVTFTQEYSNRCLLRIATGPVFAF
jgi:hypothetical protein